MGLPGNNPGIWGEAVRTALNDSGDQLAHEHEVDVKQAQLDTAELQELERSEFYGGTPRARQPSRLRSIIARVFRRSA